MTEAARCHCGSRQYRFKDRFVCDTCDLETEMCQCAMGTSDAAKRRIAETKKKGGTR